MIYAEISISHFFVTFCLQKYLTKLCQVPDGFLFCDQSIIRGESRCWGYFRSIQHQHQRHIDQRLPQFRPAAMECGCELAGCIARNTNALRPTSTQSYAIVAPARRSSHCFHTTRCPLQCAFGVVREARKSLRSRSCRTDGCSNPERCTR
jgi:hypothetical protein